MNKYLLIYFILIFNSVFSQIKPTYCPELPLKKETFNDTDIIYSPAGIDVKPEFLGGMKEFYKSFHEAFTIPSEKPDLNGRIFISFVVEKNGALTNIKILRDLGMGSDAEVIRVIKNMPPWKPGKHHEKIVRCSYSLPINIPYMAPKSNESQLLKIVEIPDKH